MEDGKLLKLSVLIDKLTTTSKKGPDETRMKEFKKMCKQSEEIVQHSYHLLIHQLQKEHSEIRTNVVIVINELFKRSHVFRDLLVSNFQQFLELTVETDPDQPLPRPFSAAKELKKITLGFIQKWFNDFGEGYRKLSLGYTFLRQCKQIDFQDLEAQSAVQRQQSDIRQRHLNELNQRKSDDAVQELNTLRTDIADVLVQLENCFRLLMPHPDEFFVKDDNKTRNIDFDAILRECRDKYKNNEVDGESSKETIREHGMHDKTLSIEIDLSGGSKLIANKDNATVIENAREQYKLAIRKYKPSIERLIATLTKTGMNSEKLREAISIKESLTNIVEKYLELNLPTTSIEDDESEDDEFEDVPEKEGYEPVIPEHLRAEYGLEPLGSKSLQKVPLRLERQWKLGGEMGDVNDPTTIAAQAGCSSSNCDTISPNKRAAEPSEKKCADDKKAKMLEVAPKLRYDTDLLVWEEDKPTPPTVMQFESLHRFWAPITNEDSTVVKDEEAASMRQRVIDFSGKFEEVKWACRALMPSGRLCPRQDRKKCPLHGPIIPRDKTGKPTNECDKQYEEERLNNEEIAERSDPKLLAEIKSATGVELKIGAKGKGKGKGKKSKVKSDLTDIKKTLNTSRNRLEKKVLSHSSVKRVEESMNSARQKLFDDKFGNQWNYSFQS